MKYVLDTNTVSFLMRGDVDVSRELTSHDRTDVFLPQPVVAHMKRVATLRVENWRD